MLLLSFVGLLNLNMMKEREQGGKFCFLLLSWLFLLFIGRDSSGLLFILDKSDSLNFQSDFIKFSNLIYQRAIILFLCSHQYNLVQINL